MDRAEIRAILSAYRPGDPEMDEARFQQAKAAAEADPELARWWAEQQEFDRVIASKLASAEVPRGLKTQLTAWEKRTAQRSSWSRGVLLAAACIVAAAVFFSSWRGPFQPAASLADYRDEMVSFVRLQPPLDLKTSDAARAIAFLKENGAPVPASLPQRLRELEAAGCRKLRFRGHDVALICFKREDGELIHMLVIDRSAFSRWAGNSKDPQLGTENGWSTATWMDDEHAYLLTTKGSREVIERYLSTS